MKNNTKDDVPLAHISRDPLLLGALVLLSLLLIYINYSLFKNVNPWGFLCIIPTAFVSFQTLWLLLNPFAYIFEDKFEIKQSLFHIKQRYFVDVNKIGLNKKGHIIIIYHDEESELINLFGIQKNKISTLKALIEKSISGIPLK